MKLFYCGLVLFLILSCGHSSSEKQKHSLQFENLKIDWELIKQKYKPLILKTLDAKEWESKINSLKGLDSADYAGFQLKKIEGYPTFISPKNQNFSIFLIGYQAIQDKRLLSFLALEKGWAIRSVCYDKEGNYLNNFQSSMIWGDATYYERSKTDFLNDSLFIHLKQIGHSFSEDGKVLDSPKIDSSFKTNYQILPNGQFKIISKIQLR